MSDESWKSDLRLLRVSFAAYLLLWLSGMGVGMSFSNSNWTAILLGLTLVPYAVSVFAAYRTQRGLLRDGYTSHRPWHVAAAAVILNPYGLGFYPLWRVSSTAKRVLRNMHREDFQAKRMERLNGIREEEADRFLGYGAKAEVRGQYDEAFRFYSSVIDEYAGTTAAEAASTQIEILRKEGKIPP